MSGQRGSLLSRQTESLDIMQVGPRSSPSLHVNQINNIDVRDILQKNAALFKGLGKLKDFKLKLHSAKRTPHHHTSKASRLHFSISSQSTLRHNENQTLSL